MSCGSSRIGDAGQVAPGLVQFLAAGLVLHQRHARPEQDHKPIGAGHGPRQLLDCVLKAGNAFVADAEEFVLERLGVRIFPGGVLPAFGERQRLVF